MYMRTCTCMFNFFCYSGYHALSNTRGMYHVNLCGVESTDCGDGIAVCHIHTGGSYQLGTLDSLSVTFDCK